MRLEVFCEDRLGLTRELLDLLVLRSIDLRGIEIDPVGRIYLNFAEIEFNTFSSLMAEIRRIAGVTDVRTIPLDAVRAGTSCAERAAGSNAGAVSLSRSEK